MAIHQPLHHKCHHPHHHPHHPHHHHHQYSGSNLNIALSSEGCWPIEKGSTEICVLLDLILRMIMVSVMLHNVWETNENATESKCYGNWKFPLTQAWGGWDIGIEREILCLNFPSGLRVGFAHLTSKLSSVPVSFEEVETSLNVEIYFHHSQLGVRGRWVSKQGKSQRKTLLNIFKCSHPHHVILIADHYHHQRTRRLY